MSEEKSNLVGPDGQPIKTVTVPVVHYDGFVFPMHMVQDEEIAKPTEKGVKPSEIIAEMRATAREMRHRFTILAAGLVVAAKDGPEKLDAYLNEIGLVITDAKGQKFFEPSMDGDRFAEEDLNTPAQADVDLNKENSSGGSEDTSG